VGRGADELGHTGAGSDADADRRRMTADDAVRVHEALLYM
jgi:hypothetical protein